MIGRSGVVMVHGEGVPAAWRQTVLSSTITHAISQRNTQHSPLTCSTCTDDFVTRSEEFCQRSLMLSFVPFQHLKCFRFLIRSVARRRTYHVKHLRTSLKK